MMFDLVQLPQPFAAALSEQRPQDVVDADAQTPEARYGRAIARIAVGREDDARADLAAAMDTLGDVCRVELAYLDVRQRSALKDALTQASLIAERAEAESMLMARAYHVIGLAQGKLRRTNAAADALLKGIAICGQHDHKLGRAALYDTLGMLEAARGRLDYALSCFALSLVDKTLLNDQQGMAITLGNLGRVHLRAGRFRDAIDCFTRDLHIAKQLGDARGEARMLEDIGRAHMGLEEYERAAASLEACRTKAQAGGFTDLSFFAAKDMALLALARGDIDQAQTSLREAEQFMPTQAEPYFDLLLTAARGDILLARGDEGAVDTLQQAVDGFAQADLPDLEIPARISLAKALMARQLKASAEHCLLSGTRIARRDGYARYLPQLNEAMVMLDLVEGAIDERERPIVKASGDAPGSYVIRRRLGGGAFGEVFRVYDPQRGRELALKRLHLDRLYDVRERKNLIESARLELETASRVRHPGVVRVYAVGAEPDGGHYVAQELIDGRPLRDIMPGADRPVTEPYAVLGYIQQIAHALAALHDAGVVHRDLKPENVIVRASDQTPVLVDFGIARVAKFNDVAVRDVTGTITYMAPEQALGRKVDGRADIYALGVIAFEWLAGVLPLRPRGETVDAMLRDVATRKPDALSDYCPYMKDNIAPLVMRMIDKKPRRRPASAQDAARMIGELIDAAAPADHDAPTI